MFGTALQSTLAGTRLVKHCGCHTLLLPSAAAAGGLLLCTLLLGVVHNDAGALASSQLYSSTRQQDSKATLS
jgi:hypothetical protein